MGLLRSQKETKAPRNDGREASLIPHNDDLLELRKFGIIFGIALCVMGTLHLRKGNVNVYPWFYLAGASAFLLGIVMPAWLRPLHFMLKKAFLIVASVITSVVLIIIFYFILTPISLIARLFGKEFLDINWNKKRDSYWVNKECSDESVERYERQY